MNVTTFLSDTWGGGGLKITPEIAKWRLRWYCHKHLISWNNLPPLTRQQMVWVLQHQYGFSNAVLSHMFGVSIRTVRRDYLQADFMRQRNRAYLMTLVNIDKYIVYLKQ